MSFKLPERKPVTRHLVIRRAPVPQVNEMLEDAYAVLGHQLAQFKAKAAVDLFDVKEATAFGKMVSALTQLQDQERKQITKIDLSGLSEEEQLRLEEDAASYLGLTEKP